MKFQLFLPNLDKRQKIVGYIATNQKKTEHPKNKMKKCIICRKDKIEFSDEHVIPDSIGGYYHIYNVCSDCNSKLGTLVDSKLVNHKFIEFERHSLGIKGKSGTIPNPFSGTQTLKDDPEQKVIVTFNKKGQLTPKLLPKIPPLKLNDSISNFSFSLDYQDLHMKDKIIDKILSRNGLNRSQVNFQEQKERSGRPWIQSKMSVDIKDFRIGLLKIAYEFTVDSIENYFDDPLAITISEILLNCDLEKMDAEKIIFGNGFNKDILKPLEHLIDFENKNHYLVLLQGESIGLICQVNIFNCFSIAIKMSESNIYLKENIIIGINNIENKKFEKITISDLISRTFSKAEYRFQYFFPTKIELIDFIELQKNPLYDFYKFENKIPFYNKKGEVKYKDIDEKLKQKQLKKNPKGDEINQMYTEIILDEELYIKIQPTLKLYQVVSVQIEQNRIKKI